MVDLVDRPGPGLIKRGYEEEKFIHWFGRGGCARGGITGVGTVIFDATPANIVGHDPASTTSTTPQNRLIDVDGNGTIDLRISYRSFTYARFDTNYEVQQSFVFSTNGGATAGYQYDSGSQWYAYRLPIGSFIPGGFNFGQSASYLTQVCTNVNGYEYSPFWNIGDRGITGFSFKDTNNQLDYGYIEIELDPFVNAANPGGLRFFNLAYENSGSGISVGMVPEPSTLAALAFGGVGLAAAMRRRKKR